MVKNKVVKCVPNFLTVVNLILGITAILFAIKLEHPQKLLIITALILLGAIADVADGYAARKFNAVTSVGKQLDSFADLVTFGIAPIALVNYISPCDYFGIVTISSLMFVCAGVFRLIRYNLRDFTKHFTGLPITAAGVTLTLYCALYRIVHVNLPTAADSTITVSLMVLLSLFMVSRVKVRRIV